MQKSKGLSGLAARVEGGSSRGSGGVSSKTGNKQQAASSAITSLLGDDCQMIQEPRYPHMLLVGVGSMMSVIVEPSYEVHYMMLLQEGL
jgi:hypothetical protein